MLTGYVVREQGSGYGVGKKGSGRQGVYGDNGVLRCKQAGVLWVAVQRLTAKLFGALGYALCTGA